MENKINSYEIFTPEFSKIMQAETMAEAIINFNNECGDNIVTISIADLSPSQQQGGGSAQKILKNEYSKLCINPDKVFLQNPTFIKAVYSAMEQYRNASLSSKPSVTVENLRSEQIDEIVRQIAWMAWKGAANSFRMYPDSKHTFSSYWDSAKIQFNEFEHQLKSGAASLGQGEENKYKKALEYILTWDSYREHPIYKAAQEGLK